MPSSTISATTLNLFGFFIALLSTLVATSLCLLIALHRRHRQHRQNLDLFLFSTTFFAASLFSLSFFLLTVETMKADFGLGHGDDSILCRLRGYFLCVTASANFSGYCLQAVSRLIRVVYRRQPRINTIKVYTLIVICSWIFAVLILAPYLIFKSFLSFIPSENYCLILYTNLPAMIYAIIPGFGIHLGFIIFVYLRLVVFLHYTVVQNAQRELAAVKQILYIILTIGTMCIPNAIFWIIYLSTNYFHPISYRIQILSYSIGTLMMNVGMIFVNPRLRAIVLPRRQHINPQHPPAIALVLRGTNIKE